MLISLLVAVIVLGLVFLLLQQLPMPEPFRTIALVIVIIICLFWVLSFLPDAPWHHALI